MEHNLSFKTVFINFLIISSFISSYFIAELFNPEFLRDLVGGEFKVLVPYFSIFFIHMLLIVAFAFTLFKKQTKLADGELLSPKMLKKRGTTNKTRKTYAKQNWT